MIEPGRKYAQAGSGYRYGFNGKEKDDKDGVVQYDYGFRIYDPRLGRFKSVDPLAKSYPWNSSYAFAENDVIRCIDLDGKEKAVQNLDGSIEIQAVFVAFTNRPSKILMDQGPVASNYPGGNINLPIWVDKNAAVSAFEKQVVDINNDMRKQTYNIEPYVAEADMEEFGKTRKFSGARLTPASEPGTAIRYSAKLLIFKDEDEMNNSNEYLQARTNNTYSGYYLFGHSSYATLYAKDCTVGITVPSTTGFEAGAAWGERSTNPYKAILIETGSMFDGTVIGHEAFHQFTGRGHIFPGDPVVDEWMGYNSIGVLRAGDDNPVPQAPLPGTMLNLLNTIRFEKAPDPDAPPISGTGN